MYLEARRSRRSQHAADDRSLSFTDRRSRRAAAEMDPSAIPSPSPAKSAANGKRRKGGAKESTVSKTPKKDAPKDPQKAQVWQRTAKGTVLSKVSVGGDQFLQLKKLRVTVQVEGLRVRTIMDHIYYNPHGRTLEGTFKYTLPSDASVSYYAMFVGNQRPQEPRFFSGKLPSPQAIAEMAPQAIARTSPKEDWGTLREARLVAAEKGREVYEEITRQRIDPALLEQDAPNTFSGRVFPIPANGHNRVIIAYEQTLPRFQDQRVYSFAFPDEVAGLIDFSLSYNPQLAKLSRHNLRKIRCMQKQQKHFVRCLWETEKPNRNADFYFQPTTAKAAWVAGIDPLQDRRYLYAQLAVDLPQKSASKGASQAVFLLDTSLSETPQRFGVSVSLLEKILQNNPQIQQFNVLFFDVGTRWAKADGWLENTPKARAAIFRQIRRILLEGATDLSAALQALAAAPWQEAASKQALDIFFLSDGQLNWGNRDIHQILGRWSQQQRWGQTRWFAYSFGLGNEDTALYQRITRQGGAVFTCLGEAEIERCSTAHTHQAMSLDKIEIEGIEATETLVAGRQTTLYPGALLAFASRYQRDGKASITLKGSFDGQPISLPYTLDVKAHGDLAPRAWGEIAIAQLAELDDPKLTDLIVAYAQHFHIPNAHCSLLVLETDKEYKQYGLEQQQKAHKLDQLDLFIRDLFAQKGAPISMRARWRAIFRKVLQRAKALDSSAGRAALALLQAEEQAHFAFESPVMEQIWTQNDVPKTYLAERDKSAENFDPFVTEAKRRLKKAKIGGAIRSLSCIVELHPSNPRALRLVGYYLTAWERPKDAAGVFLRVLERRSFEPHAFRDLARTMQKLQRYALAAALYEILLAGNWHERFGEIKTIAREEYALLAYEATNAQRTSTSVKALLEQRKPLLGLSVPQAKLRVTLTWNTDNTDVDLWIHEPNGESCSYNTRNTRNGGALLQDITRGYGPERYENRQGPSGPYKIQLHFYGHRSNVLGNETHASVLIVLNAGTPQQEMFEKNVVLKKRGQRVDVTTLKL